ncbi:MAG TPA: hypothetical protein VEM96_18700 [Pyrinomonadaceae bacterium]|nr:hypothetical protein [Pyrinomonadaceae bacterium]
MRCATGFITDEVRWRFRNDERVGSVPAGSPAAVAVRPTTFGAGELPATVAANDRAFILYVAQEGEKQSVWLVTADEAKLDSGQARTLYDPDPNHIWNRDATQIAVASSNFK